MDDNPPVIGDWPPPNPSPRTIFSELIAKEYGSRLTSDDYLQRTGGGSLLPEQKEAEAGFSLYGKNQDSEHVMQVSEDISMGLHYFDVPKSTIRGGLSERIAGRAGFGNLTLDTSEIKKTTSFSSQTTDVRSPLLTIPPGLSPTTLLDSPIFLCNSLEELSPSTGKLAFMECDDVTYSDVAGKIGNHTTEEVGLPFSFKMPSAYLSRAETKPGLLINQSNLQHGYSQLSEEKDSCGILLEKKDLNSNTSSKVDSLEEPQECNNDRNPNGALTSVCLGSRGEDGFNWRKYGQKHVKGSEFPRSYYRCTYPNCEVKKKVECSHDGQITEIIYKGLHNHSRSFSDGEMNIDGLDQNEWRHDDLITNPYASVIEKFDQTYDEASDDIKTSPLLSKDGDVEDKHVTNRSVSEGDDCNEDENELKRRKLDACALEMSVASRTVREPRVVVQTTSEVDILDDGYRWRKYGQKVVKGNPNPRSYYKCTSPGCTVRKHVERASHDLKSVITTYEGKHNHDVPAPRNNVQANSSSTSNITTATTFPSCLLPKKADLTKLADSLVGRFEAPLPLRSFPGSFPGSFSGPTTEQSLSIPNFSFPMPHQPMYSMTNLGNMSMKMPLLPPLSSYLPLNHPPGGADFMAPKRVPKEEPAAEAGLRVSDDSSLYQVLLRTPFDRSCRYQER